MKVSHYFEWERWITGGHAQSVRNQRRMLEGEGIEYTTAPTSSADLLHLNNMGPRSLYHARRARRRGCPVVVHTHQTAEDFRDSFAFSNWLARPLGPYLDLAYGSADHLICPSEYNQRTVSATDRVASTILSNGFDPEKLEGYERLRSTYRDRYDLDSLTVFMVGHVLERKGLDTFIETARALPELDFIWFGYINPFGGGLAGRLLEGRGTRRRIRAAPENCTFTGYVEDIRGAYAAGDVFFFPTRNENEGMALLEAMACGRPAVVRDIPTFEWLKDGTDCLKAESSFVAPLTELRDEDRRRRLGDRAAERSEDFKLETLAPKLTRIYQSVLERR